MCNRYRSTKSPSQLKLAFSTANLPNFPPNYNAAPTQSLPVVRYNAETRERSLDLLRWGLVPRWAKDLKIGVQCLNARSETITTKPAFRDAFKRRRCIVPADGFYEWLHEDGGKVKKPFAFLPADDGVFGFAGLWENWQDPAGEWIRTYTIVTGEPNEAVAPFHDRMPVILEPHRYGTWLGEVDASPDELIGMLKPFPANRMRIIPASPRVNSVKNNDAQLLDAA